jgi:hypothetical protein
MISLSDHALAWRRATGVKIYNNPRHEPFHRKFPSFLARSNGLYIGLRIYIDYHDDANI